MNKIATIIVLGFLSFHIQAQEKKLLNNAPLKEWYGMSGSELIFSSGKVVNNGTTLDNRIRFSLFFHLQHQNHYDFNKHVGFYTGFALINVGFINRMHVPNTTDAEIRQRSYSLGIPLALKVGNMERGNYLAFGVEGELMFHYKRKAYYGGNKSKMSEWLSPEVNLFNPSVFAELRFHHGGYIRVKSYLLDFLVNKSTPFYLPESGVLVNYKPEQSRLAYIAIGTVLQIKKKKRATVKDV